MIAIPERHFATLRALRSIWDSERFIVIGAAAIECHLGLHWRWTLDLDLSVSSRLDAFARDLEDLGWCRERNSPQRWVAPDGSKLHRMVASAPAGWKDPDQLRLRLVAFCRGFESPALPGP